MNTPTESETIKITVFLPLEGIRTPYTLTMDKQRNLLGFDVDQDALATIKANPHVLARHRIGNDTAIPVAIDHKQLVAQSGLVRHITDKGITISREPLDAWAVQYETWLDDSQQNPFPESEELRREYFVEAAEVNRRIADGSCPGCEANRLQVEYRSRLRKLLGL